MKSFIYFLLIFLSLNEYSYCGKFPDELLERSSMGKEFLIAIPPNKDNSTRDRRGLELYITSNVDTKVTLEYLNNGYKITKDVIANKITFFSYSQNETSFSWEIRNSETVTNKTIKLTSQDSISVYVISSKEFSSDGYLAIPVESWGRSYFHLSYYDYYTPYQMGFPYDRMRGGGFIIIASKDNTIVKIKLNGRGGNTSSTVKGRKIGEEYQIILNEGESYMVLGAGINRNIFDLSGSSVISNKPVGLISFHQRTTIPGINSYKGISYDGRDFLVEMMPPVSAWGKKYYSIEFDRNNRGDFFRLVAAENDTKWTVKYYDLTTKTLINEISGTLDNPGDFFEIENDINNSPSIRGSSVWEADKPVLLMQYSYSASWDADNNFDPFMLLVTSKEQFVNNTIFQTPEYKRNASNLSFPQNHLNIICIGDTNDVTNNKLKSLELDNEPVWENNPSFLQNRIPGTNLFWVRIDVEPGSHVINGDTKFGAYIYGFGEHDSYGWPAAIGMDIINVVDTIPPQFYSYEKCNYYIVDVTDSIFGNTEEFPIQEDKGIASIELDDDSYNCTLEFISDSTIDTSVYHPLFIIKLNITDPDKTARAIISAMDMAGNSAKDTIDFIPGEGPNVRVDFLVDKRDTTKLREYQPVYLQFSSKNWDRSEFTTADIELCYPSKWLQFTDSIYIDTASGDMANATYTKRKELDTTYLTITFTDPDGISHDAVYAHMYFIPLLSDELIYIPKVIDIQTDGAEPCVSSNFEPIVGNVCAHDLRQIVSSGEKYFLNKINPNPAEDYAEIEYSIGIEASTEINIYNINGLKVLNYKNEILKPGIYKEKIPLNNFNSGLYFIQIKSGPFYKTIDFIISK